MMRKFIKGTMQFIVFGYIAVVMILTFDGVISGSDRSELINMIGLMGAITVIIEAILLIARLTYDEVKRN